MVQKKSGIFRAFEVTTIGQNTRKLLHHYLALRLSEDIRLMRLDKKDLVRAVSELNRQMGFERDETATAEQAQRMLIEAGVMPGDNIASHELVRMREERMPVLNPKI